MVLFKIKNSNFDCGTLQYPTISANNKRYIFRGDPVYGTYNPKRIEESEGENGSDPGIGCWTKFIFVVIMLIIITGIAVILALVAFRDDENGMDVNIV